MSRPRILSQSQERAAAAAYAAGESALQVGRSYGVSRTTVLAAVARCGGRTRPREVYAAQNGIRCRIFSPEKEREIVAEYLAGADGQTLAERHGCADTTVYSVLKRSGVIPRTQREAKSRTLDESCFDDAHLREDASYFTGLLMADGCVYSRGTAGKSIRLSLAEQDGATVRAFRDFLKSGCAVSVQPPGKRGRQRMCTLTVTSDRLTAALAAYGVTERKSLTAVVRGGMEGNRHFWRGCIDGDGWVGIERPAVGKVRPILGVTGSRRTVEQFIGFLQTFAATRAVPRPNGKAWMVMVAGRYAVQAIHTLYGGCTVAMERKNAVAQDVIRRFTPDDFEPRRDWGWLTAEAVERLRADLGSWAAVSRELRIDAGQLGRMRKAWAAATRPAAPG